MSFLVLAALVLGIGVNSAMFSVVNAVLLRPVSLYHPESLVNIYAKSTQSSTVTVSYPEYRDWKQQSHSFEDMAAVQPLYINLTEKGSPERLRGMRVTSSYFTILGLPPAMGRDFNEDDERPGAPRVAVISHGMWQRRFGGDPAVLGKTIRLDDEPYTIIGVLPSNAYVLLWDVWVGIGPFLNEHMMNRETRRLLVRARLAPSVSLAQAQAEMDTIASRLAAQYPESNKDMGANIMGLTETIASNSKQLWLIVLASGLILLLACVNVVTVFVASAVERRKELSVRLALGAARFAVLRQLFVQSLIFAAIGASLGLLVAKVGLAYLIDRFPTAVPRFRETTVDHTVLWFTVCLALGSTFLSSILPGLYVSKLNINNELKGDWNWTTLSRYRVIGQSTLIVVEVALAASLSLVSGLLIKSFYELEKVDLGFNPHNVVSFQLTLPQARYKEERARAAFYRQAIQNLKAIPGVQSASASYTLPAATTTHFINLQVDTQSPLATERPFVDSSSILPGFFSAMRIPIIQGRDFTDADSVEAVPVAIIDEVLAARMWPGQNPLGKRLRLADLSDARPPWREIVGVVRQVKYFGPESKVDRMQVYDPVYQDPPFVMSFVMETASTAVTLRIPAEKAIHDLAPEVPLDNFQTLDEFLDQMASGRRVSFLLLTGFAAIGIVLGMIGIYGVVSNSVLRRRREIAIRMALGASVQSSIFLVMRLGLLATLGGIALGSALVVSLTRILSAFLFGVTAIDPSVYLLSALAIGALAFIASLVPAVAVLRLSPQDVLRE